MANILNAQRTIYGVHLQNCEFTKRPFTLLPNSTLNQKFDIAASSVVPNQAYPYFIGITFGIGGHQIVSGTNGRVKLEPKLHKARDASCFDPFPCVLRTTDNDLTTLQRQNYRLRKNLTINGIQYWAYYLRKHDINALTPGVNLINVNNGVTTVTPFTPLISDLSPTPVALTNGSVNISTTDFIGASVPTSIPITADEVTDMLDAITIMFGDPYYAIVSEVATCTGYEMLVGDTMESVATQISSFNSSAYTLTSLRGGFTLNLDVGNTEPLIY